MSNEEGQPMKDKEEKRTLPPFDNEDQQDAADQEDSFDFGEMENIKDAGQSEEAERAEQEAAQVKINLQHRRDTTENAIAEAYGETDLVKRSKMIASMQGFKFIHFKPVKDEFIMQARTDSELNRLAVFDALFDNGSGRVPFPHKDTFRGRLVDHEGTVFTANRLKTPEITRAVNAAGLDNPSARQVTESYLNWAMQHERDGLLEHFEAKMPKWDGKERMETYIIDTLKCFDTPLTREVCKYFWLSLYNRITSPGTPAPISISLIGGQGAGKSRFSRLICEHIMGDPNAIPTPLDWSVKNFNPFLRNITGNSIVANVAEMGGLRKADLERMKAFAAQDTDDLDFKFEDTIVKPRQWIIIMDGNSYDGLQRDDTGNRRFYPIFAFQKPDEDGQPQWETRGVTADYSNFHNDVWQLMAESRAWMDENRRDGYLKLIHKVTADLANFSNDEMKQARGIMRDEVSDNFLVQALKTGTYSNSPTKGWFISNGGILLAFHNISRVMPHSKALVPRMEALGFEKGKYMNERGFWLKYIDAEQGTIKDLNSLLAMTFFDEADEVPFEEYVKHIADIRSGKDSDQGGAF